MLGLAEIIDAGSYAVGALFVVPLAYVALACFGPNQAHNYGDILFATSRFLNAFAKQFGTLVAWLTLIMVLIQTIVVLQRYVFGVNFIWLQESITYFHGALFMLAAGYTLYKDGHVRVDVLYRDASPVHKALVNLAGIYLFLVPMMILILQISDTYVDIAWRVREGSPETSGLQGVYLLKTIILIFPILLLLQAWSLAAESVLTLTGRQGTISSNETDRGGGQHVL